MNMRWPGRSAAVVLMALGAAALVAAPPDKAPEDGAPKAAPPTDTIKLFLMDGSVLAGKLGIKDLTVETAFGTLKIPVIEIKGITPGLESHPELAEKVASLVDALGSADFNKREEAQKELAKMGPAIRNELARFAKDADAERRTRVQALLDDIDAQLEEQEEMAPTDQPFARGDTIETTQFTVVGKIVERQFNITSLYGPLTIKLGDLRRAHRDLGGREDIRKSLAVSGPDSQGGRYKVSGIKVEKGDVINVTATGQVTMTPWGARSFVGPDGSSNFSWFIQGQIPGGALVGRIGDSGQPFAVGSKKKWTADRAGVLQFCVGLPPEYSGNQFPGQFDLKIVVTPK